MVVAEMGVLVLCLSGALMAFAYIAFQYLVSWRKERERRARDLQEEEERWRRECDLRRVRRGRS